jgi:hypothetical protein
LGYKFKEGDNMDIEFREKARIAYETMPDDKKQNVNEILSLLKHNGLQSLDINSRKKIKDRGLDVWRI